MKRPALLLAFLLALEATAPAADHSVARLWNEAMLAAIRGDLARPTVQARNLFHCSAAMYDAWAAYDSTSETFLLGKSVGGYFVPFAGVPAVPDVAAARDEAISHAAYRFLRHRYAGAPNAGAALKLFDSLHASLGYDTLFTSVDYATGSPAALGNYIAASMISFGLQDGANQAGGYAYALYVPFNPPMVLRDPGNPRLTDPNRWQPLTFVLFADQHGNIVDSSTPKFVTPQWGSVTPFALDPADLTIYTSAGYEQYVWHDPGAPARLDTSDGFDEMSELYKWAFELVAVWSSHHDAGDGVTIDISPASIGNVQELPDTPAGMIDFYDLTGGGDNGEGYDLNPKTGLPYEPQVVPRGDYTRVLSEFWADGPNSETPPGHWFSILNRVSDHPALVRRFKGTGVLLDSLEWDVKSYFVLGGALHDAGIAAWGAKAYYDYIRPISVIRWMGDKGQASDPLRPDFNPTAFRTIPGYIEIVEPGDSLAGPGGANVGKLKLRAWRSHEVLDSALDESAGVGWRLAERWWPYMRATFVTPPFAGYVSGHSTFSRAAAEVLTLFTGDEYFPGGMGEFHAAQNEFLRVEEGPSVDVTLQWARYRDASDQCSLSRIWTGIHPPVDDIAGRKMGAIVGAGAFARAEQFFSGTVSSVAEAGERGAGPGVYPNPAPSGMPVNIEVASGERTVGIDVYNVLGQELRRLVLDLPGQSGAIGSAASVTPVTIPTTGLIPGVYFIRIRQAPSDRFVRLLLIR